jgi:uncharacterized RDD family membrane protein YckC
MMYDKPRDPTAVMGRRIFAYIIDIVAVGILVSLLFRPDVTSYDVPVGVDNACDFVEQLESADGWCIEGDDEVVFVDQEQFFTGIAIQLALSFLNLVLLQAATGASLGKMLLGLRVIREDGQVAGFGQMFLRWVFLLVDAVFCFLIGLITALVSRGHRRVGDMVARTYVVRPDDVALFQAGFPGSGGAPSPQSWQPPPDQWTPPAPPPGPGSPPPAPPPPAGPGSPPPWTPGQ